MQEQEAFNLKAPLFKTQRGSRFHPDVLQNGFVNFMINQG
jgi:integrase/recombinase XerD